MKCQSCGKKLDDVDSSCKMCTFCGSVIDAKDGASKEAKTG